MSLKEFAFIVSRSFDFYTWFPVGLLIAVFNSGLSYEQIKILLPVLFLLDVILPISLFFFGLKRGKISDIDVTKRQERHILFGTMSLILLISTLVAFFLGNHLFFVLNLISLAVGVSLFFITLRFKLSGHMLMNTGSVFVISYLFDWKTIWLFLIIPVVAFARVYLKKHTMAEILTGSLLGFIEPYLILKYFKLI